MRVISLLEGAVRSNQSLRTFQRTIERGEGPPIIEISQRRRGILQADFEAWLLARRRPTPVLEVPARRPGRPRKLIPASQPMSLASQTGAAGQMGRRDE